MKGLVCVVAGHRYAQAPDVHEPFPVLRCERCGRTRTLSPGSEPESWGARHDRRLAADRSVDGGYDPPRP